LAEVSESDGELLRARYEGRGGEPKVEEESSLGCGCVWEVVAMEVEEAAAEFFLRVKGIRSLLEDAARLG